MKAIFNPQFTIFNQFSIINDQFLLPDAGFKNWKLDTECKLKIENCEYASLEDC